MNYSTARPLIKTGDLLAFSHKPWVTWKDYVQHLVRIATESEFNHIGLAYVAHDRVFVLEASSLGVRLFPLSLCLPFYIVSNPETLSTAAADFAFSLLGKPYESKWKMLLNFLFGNLKLKENDEWQCCEYVNAILRVNDQWLALEDIPGVIVEEAIENWGALNYVKKD